MKKLILLALAVCMLLASCDLLSAILEPETPEHVHEWEEQEVIKEPNCTEKGERLLICKTCQEQKTEELPALGHGWDDGWFTTPPTCQEDGERTYTCGVCHATKTEVVKASEEYHNWGNGEETKAPTCTEKGTRHFICNLCNAEQDMEIDALGHDWDEGVVDEVNGKITYSCKREGCDATRTEDYHIHKWVEAGVLKEQTCSSEGTMQYTCSECNEIKTEPIPADEVSHTYSSEWSNDETHHWHSATCGHAASISADQSLGYGEHDFGEQVIVTVATCSTEGTKKQTCKTCGYEKFETYTDATSHTFSTEWSHDDEQHWHAVTCAHEGVTVVKEDHSFGDAEVIVEGNCTTDGTERYTCTVCGYSYEEEIPNVFYHKVDTATNKCTECNEVFYFQINWNSNTAKLVPRSPNSGLKNVIIPEYVANWNYSWWYRPDSIKSLYTPTLESVVIPESVKTIEYQAFRDLTKLTSVTLPDSLETIEQEAFMGCTALESIRIPASVTLIGAQAFEGCTNLKDVYYDGTATQLNAICKKNVFTTDGIIFHFSE